MQVLARTSKANRQVTSAGPSASPGPHIGHFPEVGPAMSGMAAIGHDFSRIAIHARPPAIQTKLTVNQPGDVYEREADHVADQVMRMTAPSSIGSSSTTIQRACAECEDEKDKRPEVAQGVEGQVEENPFASYAVFRKATFAAPSATPAPSMPGRLNSSGGDRLPAETLRTMGGAFGREFSQVRVHHDAEAGEMSGQLNALAFTHRNHVYFGKGMYDPGGASGKRLLAHELTHVVQQGYAGPRSRGQTGSQAIEAHASRPMIQRVATWAAATVHEVNSLADVMVNRVAAGFTPPKLNGSIVLSSAAVRTALVKPALAAGATAAGAVQVTVATVPTNTGCADESVLSAGPWTLNIPKATVGARFASLAACAGAGNTTFRGIGKPTDAAMFAANRRHENHHAADNQTAFNGSIGAWDAKLAAAAAAGTPFTGATEAAATASLHAAMGGTPDQVADAYLTECLRLGGVFHGTPAGGVISISNPTADASCATSSADGTNPS